MPKKKPKADDDKPGNPPILLRLPAEVGMPLLARATKESRTIQSIILEIVAAHFAVSDFVAPSRGQPKKPTMD